MVTYSLTKEEAERVSAIRANLGRLNIDAKTLGEHFGMSNAHTLDVLKGRYTSDKTDTWLTQYEHYLSKLLGVRYVQPYFNDLHAD